MTRRHVILVGLPGAGKSTIGALVAAALDAPFVDLDEAIERRAGKSVARVFEEDGEAAFRALEAELGGAALAGPPSVVAPGAGFFPRDVTRAMTPGSGLVVYLETAPEEAAARLGGAAGRPLLAGDDTGARIAALLAVREPSYRRADRIVTTGGRRPDEVAADVVSLARDLAGW